jgi:hypothetical protein
LGRCIIALSYRRGKNDFTLYINGLVGVRSVVEPVFVIGTGVVMTQYG